VRKSGIVSLLLLLAACSQTGSATPPSTPPATTQPLPPTTAITEEVLAGEVQNLVEVTEDLRGLEFKQSPAIRLVSYQEMTDWLRERRGDPVPDEAAFRAAYYRMLGVIDQDFDLAAYQDAAYERVAGAYDSTTGEVLVAIPEGGLTALARVTLVHEIVHALTDQHFDFQARLEAMTNSEQVDAMTALAEGDAEYFASAYADRFLSTQERLEVQLEAIGYAGRVAAFPDVSPYLLEDIAFNYEAGAAFVEELVAEGGIAAVNATYAHPPASSEQIYHPLRFGRGEPSIPVDLSTIPVYTETMPGEEFRLMETGTWGEHGFRALMLNGLPRSDAIQASTGWGGDAYAVWWDGEEVLLLVVAEADTRQDATQLASAMGRWGLQTIGAGSSDFGGIAFRGDQTYAFVATSGTRMLFVAASDLEAGQDLRNSFYPEF